jgi:hypothetical protein
MIGSSGQDGESCVNKEQGAAAQIKSPGAAVSLSQNADVEPAAVRSMSEIEPRALQTEAGLKLVLMTMIGLVLKSVVPASDRKSTRG